MSVGDAEFAAAVWEHSTCGICAVDAAGSIVLMNAAARRILGGAAATADLGMSCEKALADHPPLSRLLCEALAGRPPLSRAEMGVERPDGELITLGFSLASLPGQAGAVRGAALVFRDLTQIERSDERERLQRRLAALGEMAAGLAHELRNPLAGMEVLAGLLQRRLAGDRDALELLIELRGQLRRLADTVTASLDYLRPVALRREPVDPVELAEEVLAVGLRRSPRPAHVSRSYAPLLPAVEADRHLLGVALVNLIVNACEAMAGAADSRLELAIEVGPAPELSQAVRIDRDAFAAGAASSGLRSPSARCANVCRATGSPDKTAGERSSPRGPARELRIAVIDNGPGIPEEIRDRIFDPFFTTRESGSGIGLANVQKIVLAHGGSLSLQTSGCGSEFRLHLPLPVEAR